MEYLRYKRTVQTFWIFVGCFCLLLTRLYFIQVKSNSELAERAYAQQNQVISLEEAARGDILDRNRVPFTGTLVVNRVVLFPLLIEDKALATEKLSAILNIPSKSILKNMGDKPVVLSEEISQEQALKINRENISGIKVYPYKKRYEEKPLAVHVIGHLGKINNREIYDYQNVISREGSQKDYKKNDIVGKLGLEKTYEALLKGTQNEHFVALPTDARNKPLKGIEIKSVSARDKRRSHIVLTLDKRIQAIIEEVLEEETVTDGAVVVMDVESGDILAMASRPTFDPNDVGGSLSEAGDSHVFLDNCVQLVQPGSVFKPVVAAAALELGVVKPESQFLCLGAHDDLVRCYRDEGHGVISFYQAMAHSCNPVFARLGQEVGSDNLIDFAKKLGFDNHDLLGFPAASRPGYSLEKLREPYAIINSSIGQGPVLATPLQITAMMATFARGGIYKKPRLVREVLDGNYKVNKIFAVDEGHRVISEENCNLINDMFAAVTSFGTGQMANVPGWGSAGKTGSAQINKNEGIVDAWFTGYAPQRAPKYAVTVLIKGGESGGRYAAPVFRRVMERILELE